MDSTVVRVIICLCLGYAFGNIQTGLFVGKAKHVDIRQHGSGNSGTTNAMRTLGLGAGLITFAGDFIKAMIPCLLVRFLIYPGLDITELLVLIAGLGAILGHNYPCWLKFKGGKGIASSCGSIVTFDPLVIPFAAVCFFVPVLITRYVSVGSLLLSVCFVAFVSITRQGDPYYMYMVIVTVVMLVLAVIRHRTNISRLIAGNENKISLGGKKDGK
ncbi:MAG: glycerol-3-phosphate 1-O-acyltransferase PlsY [Lachnospiraceae bacterium]|nr:glycerol-3-phosphate 1-O-acyltransferase PlsY [Lachnospiraceae bacterium]